MINRTLMRARSLPAAFVQKTIRNSYYFVGLMGCLSLISSLFFIFRCFPPKFDDAVNMVDVMMYLRRGFGGIVDQVNAPGPVGFMWAAMGASIANNALFGARLSMWFAWLLLLTGYMLVEGKTGGRYPVVGFLLAALLCPHSNMSQALVLSEGPSLLFAGFGVITFVISSDRNQFTFQMVGALLIGLAICTRQFYLALAAAVLLAFLIRELDKDFLFLTIRGACLGLIMLAPIAVVTVIWGGITSPNIRSGIAYPDQNVDVGFSISRALTALGYFVIYTGIFTLPIVWRRTRLANLVILSLVSCGVASAVMAGGIFPAPGPIWSLLSKLQNITLGQNFVVAWTLIFGGAFITLVSLSMINVETLHKRLFEVISVLFAMLFFLEQIFVGGVPFYERYMLIVMPFIGAVYSEALVRTDVFLRWYLLPAPIAYFMLWRYAF
jgi:hypothetical protein